MYERLRGVAGSYTQHCLRHAAVGSLAKVGSSREKEKTHASAMGKPTPLHRAQRMGTRHLHNLRGDYYGII